MGLVLRWHRETQRSQKFLKFILYFVYMVLRPNVLPTLGFSIAKATIEAQSNFARHPEKVTFQESYIILKHNVWDLI